MPFLCLSGHLIEAGDQLPVVTLGDAGVPMVGLQKGNHSISQMQNYDVVHMNTSKYCDSKPGPLGWLHDTAYFEGCENGVS